MSWKPNASLFFEYKLLLISALFLISLLSVPSSLLATESSKDQSDLSSGLQEFQNQQYRKALLLFHQFVKANPADGRGYLFRGLTLNRLGRFQLALGDLLQAEELGQSFSRFDIEIAWAWLEYGDSDKARQRLDSYLKVYENDAKAYEFLGRAWLKLGDLDNAEANLTKALTLDKALEPTIQLYLAVMERRRGNVRGAYENLTNIILQHPESRLGKTLAKTFLNEKTENLAKRWRGTIATGLGYNDNVIALPDDFALPSDISSKDSLYKKLEISVAYNLKRSKLQVLTAGYGFSNNLVNEVERFDVLDQFFYLSYLLNYRSFLTASVLLSDQYTQVNRDSFRNEIAVRSMLTWRMGKNLTLETGYRFARGNYLRSSTPSNNRDAKSHSLFTTGHLLLPDYNLHFYTSFTHTWVNTKGLNFEVESNSLRLGMNANLPWQVIFEADASRTWDDYENPNTLSFTAQRRDDISNRISLQLSRPVYKRLSAYLTYTYTNKDSNIIFFDYEQNLVEAGLSLSF
ncbi:MAG: tetratricopeptide repeat protein [Gammaproteobacteria bacterium]|nr:tetratricopeptide repeat protein [Gammaproteobacteria bacterium]